MAETGQGNQDAQLMEPVDLTRADAMLAIAEVFEANPAVGAALHAAMRDWAKAKRTTAQPVSNQLAAAMMRERMEAALLRLMVGGVSEG